MGSSLEQVSDEWLVFHKLIGLVDGSRDAAVSRVHRTEALQLRFRGKWQQFEVHPSEDVPPHVQPIIEDCNKAHCYAHELRYDMRAKSWTTTLCHFKSNFARVGWPRQDEEEEDEGEGDEEEDEEEGEDAEDDEEDEDDEEEEEEEEEEDSHIMCIR
ncbi:hypothetical protein FOCC_FOCC004741 [Frankliniella occidentalis]|nr:hypothetical protein FOCC_FOCC004741 [Frankliniella occidentalis]